jgi:hypothetical protein
MNGIQHDSKGGDAVPEFLIDILAAIVVLGHFVWDAFPYLILFFGVSFWLLVKWRVG